MSEHAVVIAGGGPTGLMLAGELALAKVDVAIVERRDSAELALPRSRGLQSRAIEVLDQRGIAERFLAEGQPAQVQSFAGIRLDISDFPTRHPYGLALMQSDFERILAGWVEELGVPIARRREVTGVAAGASGVEVRLAGGDALRATYLVGCDGGRSVVRRAAGIGFPGLEPSKSWLMAEVGMDEEPALGLRPEGGGIGPAANGRFGVVVAEAALPEGALPEGDEAALADLREALVAVYGSDFGAHDLAWISRFTDATRQAASYREGRVLLAGDAAHIHPPQGGQGISLGVTDAVNLGWKLALVVHGVAPERLLDSYHAERHPVGARVLETARAQTALAGADERTKALRDVLAGLLAMDEPRRRIAGMMSGLDVHYDIGGSHPLVGRRMPDLDLVTEEGPVRVFALLHEARPVLLDLLGGAGEGFDLGPWAARVPLARATHAGAWELPVIGEVEAPQAVLVRPDGHVAWVGAAGDPALPAALRTWFGPAS